MTEQEGQEVERLAMLLAANMKNAFDKTEDQADLKWRSFSSKSIRWLRVDAEIADDSESCKQVIVGYETVPKYELRCEDEETIL